MALHGQGHQSYVLSLMWQLQVKISATKYSSKAGITGHGGWRQNILCHISAGLGLCMWLIKEAQLESGNLLSCIT